MTLAQLSRRVRKHMRLAYHVEPQRGHEAAFALVTRATAEMLGFVIDERGKVTKP